MNVCSPYLAGGVISAMPTTEDLPCVLLVKPHGLVFHSPVRRTATRAFSSGWTAIHYGLLLPGVCGLLMPPSPL